MGSAKAACHSRAADFKRGVRATWPLALAAQQASSFSRPVAHNKATRNKLGACMPLASSFSPSKSKSASGL